MKKPETCDCGHYKCKGIKYWAPSPFAQEIYEDNRDYLMCDGERHEAAMDI